MTEGQELLVSATVRVVRRCLEGASAEVIAAVAAEVGRMEPIPAGPALAAAAAVAQGVDEARTMARVG